MINIHQSNTQLQTHFIEIAPSLNCILLEMNTKDAKTFNQDHNIQVEWGLDNLQHQFQSRIIVIDDMIGVQIPRKIIRQQLRNQYRLKPPTPIDAEFAIDGEIFKGQIEDLSTGGLKIIIQSSQAPSFESSVEGEIEVLGVIIQFDANIKHIQINENKCVIGIEFKPLAKNFETALSKYILQQQIQMSRYRD